MSPAGRVHGMQSACVVHHMFMPGGIMSPAACRSSVWVQSARVVHLHAVNSTETHLIEVHSGRLRFVMRSGDVGPVLRVTPVHVPARLLTVPCMASDAAPPAMQACPWLASRMLLGCQKS